MGFIDYMKHRVLGLVLAIICFGFLIAIIAPNNSDMAGMIYLLLAVLFGIASAYFFKTQH
jgi:hypothetical protein